LTIRWDWHIIGAKAGEGGGSSHYELIWEIPVNIIRRKRGETSIDACTRLFPEARKVLEEQLMGLGEYWDTGAIPIIGVTKWIFTTVQNVAA